ncbi:hypothetical protein [Vreelandella sp. V005]|uniref:hypothetical protein n=1 Tax=Vreelandella sp. V005 TaxID=3459608 RepID=UPI004043A9B0
MTHMCDNSIAPGAFNLGFNVTVVANATASRPVVQSDQGTVLSAQASQERSLTPTRVLYAVVADCSGRLLPRLTSMAISLGKIMSLGFLL